MHTSPRFDSEVKLGARYRAVLLQAPVWLLITIHKYLCLNASSVIKALNMSSLRRHVRSAARCWHFLSGWRRLRVLSPKGQPAAEPFHEPPHVHDIKVDIVSEVGADVGVSVQQGAVERSPAHTDHHSNEAQQQQDQAGVSAHLICKKATNAVRVHRQHDETFSIPFLSETNCSRRRNRTVLAPVLRLTEPNFAFGVLFVNSVARGRQPVQRRSPPFQDGNQTVRGRVLEETQRQKEGSSAALGVWSCWQKQWEDDGHVQQFCACWGY